MNPFLILTASSFKSQYFIDLKTKDNMNGFSVERDSSQKSQWSEITPGSQHMENAHHM
jgi:hypothetical protein